jgi:uncharacterized phage protein (TIGR02220 family)
VSRFNQETGRNFKALTDKTKKHINARIEEGYIFEDFEKVICYKYKQWKNDDKMKSYIRPETFFGTKFESYLNECPVGKPMQSIDRSNRVEVKLSNM